MKHAYQYQYQYQYQRQSSLIITTVISSSILWTHGARIFLKGDFDETKEVPDKN